MNTFQQEQLQTALSYNEQGLNILPLVYESKKPLAKWKHWQERPQTADDVRAMYDHAKPQNVGIIGGAVSGNLSVFDFDSKRAFNDCRIPFEYVLNHTLSVNTRRGAHVYLRMTNTMNSGQMYRNGVKIGDIKAEGGYVVAPKSRLLHDDFQYTFFDDFGEILTLEPEEIFSIFTAAGVTFSQSPKKQESKDTFQQLINPDLRTCRISPALFDAVFKNPMKGQRSDREQALIYRLYCIGWGFYETAELFRRYGHGGTHYGQYPKEKRISYLQTCWNKAASYYAGNASDFDRTLDKIRDNSQNIFTGRTADTDRAVLLSIVQKCRESGVISPNVSHRDISERAGVTLETARKAISRLSAFKVISCTLSDRATAAAKIELKPDVLFSECDKVSTYLHIIPVLGIKGIETEQGADLYRYGALGKKGQLVLRVLTESKKATSAEILEKTGLNRRAIERILKRSTWAGIVIKNGRGLYSINPNVDLSEAARRLGVDGKGEKQRRQHNAERDAYKGHLAKKKRK